jgi:hypothetical protein
MISMAIWKEDERGKECKATENATVFANPSSNAHLSHLTVLYSNVETPSSNGKHVSPSSDVSRNTGQGVCV